MNMSPSKYTILLESVAPVIEDGVATNGTGGANGTGDGTGNATGSSNTAATSSLAAQEHREKPISTLALKAMPLDKSAQCHRP